GLRESLRALAGDARRLAGALAEDDPRALRRGGRAVSAARNDAGRAEAADSVGGSAFGGEGTARVAQRVSRRGRRGHRRGARARRGGSAPWRARAVRGLAR